MAISPEQSLVDLDAITSVDDGDLLHVNRSGSDYKQTKSNFKKDLARYYEFGNTSLLTSQADALSASNGAGFYTGKINSYGHQVETDSPVNNSGYVILAIYSSNYMRIEFESVDGGRRYEKLKQNGTWDNDWKELPRRAEIDALNNSFARDIATISGGSSKTFTVANSSRMLLVLLGTNAARMGVYNVFTSSSGTSTIVAVLDGANISITSGTNTITIAHTVSGTNNIYVNAIVFAGSITA